MQLQATAQIVLDAVQAKYPGNEHVKQCGSGNHDGVCFDPSLPHIIYHVYAHKENCERGEQMPCAKLNMPEVRWIPINKPVATEKEDPYDPKVMAAYHQGLTDGEAIWRPSWYEAVDALKKCRGEEKP